jgi:hypothetical protein
MALTIRTTGLEQYAPGGEARVKVLLIAGAGAGKGHPLDTKLLTPGGYVELGKLGVGDEVIGSNGLPTRITAIYDRGVLPICKVTLNDGTSVRVDPEHLWRVRTTHDWYTVATQDLGELRRSASATETLRYEIPLVASVQHPEQKLPLDPYVLGALLGNGHFGLDHVQLTIPFGPEWEEQVAAIEGLTPAWMRVREVTRKRNATARQFHLHDCLPILREMGLVGKLSRDKFIPLEYLFADMTSRIQLLGGMMDTDGGMQGNTTWYYTTSPQLAEDVAELVRSLGGWAAIKVQPRGDGKPVEHNVMIRLRGVNPFKFGPKRGRWKDVSRRHHRRIASVVEDGYAEVRCITVEAPDQLYVTENHTVTHNTRWASYFPKPIYADCEGGLASVADRRVPYVTINNSTDMADFLNHVKMDGRFPEDKRTVQTVVIDTLDAYQRKLKNEWLEVNKKESFSGWEAWGFLDQKMGLLLTKLLNLDVNIVVAAHYKDKVTRDDDKESHELMLQLSGDIKDTAYNDFDLVGWMGTYWEAVAGERVQKRGITFKPSPDKPFLKDRLHVTPPWLEVTFAPSDYENLFARIAAKADELVPGETVGQIESEQPQTPPTVATPDQVPSGAIAQPGTVELPLAQMDKPTLLKKARDLGVTTLKDGSPIKGNTLKSELIAALEAHRVKPTEEVSPADAEPERLADKMVAPGGAELSVPRQASAPAVESVAEGVVDTATGELLAGDEPAGEDDAESDGPPAVLEAVPPKEPTREEAVATVEEKLGGEVISDVQTTAAAAGLARRRQAAQQSQPAPASAAGNCTDCGKDLTDEDQNYVKLSRIKYRTLLCQSDYIKRKSA